MQKLLLSFLLFIFVLTTVIVIINPRLHKTVSIPDSNTDIALQNKEVIANKTNKIKNIDTLKHTNANLKNIDNLKTEKDLSIKNKDNFKNIEGQLNSIDNIQDNKIQFKHHEESPFLKKIKEREKYRIKESENYTPEYPNTKASNTSQLPKVAIPQQKTGYNYEYRQQIQPEPKRIPPQERPDVTISWNIWRSNLGNAIADDFEQWAKVNGTYMFVFNVDRYRQISNPKVFLIGFSYSPENLSAAYSYLNRLSGSPILEFPQGSRREKVSAIYTILISDHTSDKSLDASNFSDYETLR